MLSVAGRAGLADVIALLCFDVVRLCAICVVRLGGDRRDHTVDQPQQSTHSPGHTLHTTHLLHATQPPTLLLLFFSLLNISLKVDIALR